MFGEPFMLRCPVQGLVKSPDGRCSQMVARDDAGHLLEHCYWHQKVHDGIGEATTREASIALTKRR